MARDIPGTATNRLDVGDVAALDLTGTAITMHAWVRPDTVSGTDPIMAKWASGALAYLMFLSAGKIVGQTGNGGGSQDATLTGATALTTGAWSSVAFTRSGASRVVYLNGVSDGSDSGGSTTMVGNAEGFKIGGDGFGVNFFDGRIAGVAIWNVALTAAEVLALAKSVSPLKVRPVNLKGFWPLYGAAYPEPDLSGNSNNATQTGTVNAADHAPVGPIAF